ncbi:MAG: CehA/McbA family metallohydrolase, partial [Planctomycetota bacterium]
VEPVDRVRADGEFKFGQHEALDLWWCQDDYWTQAYGITPIGDPITIATQQGEARRPHEIHYLRDGQSAWPIPAQTSRSFERRVFAKPDTFALISAVAQRRQQPTAEFRLRVTDPSGPCAHSRISLFAGEQLIASGLTDDSGYLVSAVPPGSYRWKVQSQGRTSDGNWDSANPEPQTVVLEQLGRIAGLFRDEAGQGVPCRLAFHGQQIADPHFGPDSAVHGVRNLWHTPNGEFDIALRPGRYEVIVSRGPEYDAVFETVQIKAGETTRLDGELVRSVDTTGWLSAELHSHSSPSGDNTSSQRGRVLNLLVEQLEFIPCTEHQRITNYDAHLKAFGAQSLALTCPGMELTGSPLPLNHQNVFPLVEHAHTQDGGAPTVNPNPEYQIERIALWDDGSDKVVQINHPDIAQMVGDRDKDRTPDAGFRKMFHYTDVIEVHPPELIFGELEVGEGGWEGRGNVILNWIQLLNLGYRVPGVVNTDAHWNYYGSGWLRNYIRVANDDPATVQLEDVCHALERGEVVMTNGPFLEVTARCGDKTAGPGQDLRADTEEVTLAIRVQCPNWLDVNRVQIFVNGRAGETLNFRRRAQPKMFSDGVVKFDETIRVRLPKDAHLIVATANEGQMLGRVYGPEQGEVMPVAVTNPIFVDRDGNGFVANGDSLGIPLPVEPDHVPTHGHPVHNASTAPARR